MESQNDMGLSVFLSTHLYYVRKPESPRTTLPGMDSEAVQPRGWRACFGVKTAPQLVA